MTTAYFGQELNNLRLVQSSLFLEEFKDDQLRLVDDGLRLDPDHGLLKPLDLTALRDVLGLDFEVKVLKPVRIFSFEARQRAHAPLEWHHLEHRVHRSVERRRPSVAALLVRVVDQDDGRAQRIIDALRRVQCEAIVSCIVFVGPNRRRVKCINHDQIIGFRLH